MQKMFAQSIFLLPLLALPLLAQTEADRCAALARMKIPDVEIATANLAPAGPSGRGGGLLPAHCVVRGAINKRVGFGGKKFAIGFELRLPGIPVGLLPIGDRENGAGEGRSVRPFLRHPSDQPRTERHELHDGWRRQSNWL